MAPSPFTAWLRANGHADLCPTTDDPEPIASRVEHLRRAGGTEEQVRDLWRLWSEWRAEASASRRARAADRAPCTCGDGLCDRHGLGL